MADIAVANTTSNIQGQTVVLAGRDTTVTGTITFDRDPSAPFAVSANSAVVTNLDADKLDGLDWSTATAWTSFTPTWTGTGGTPSVGNGTLTGRYLNFGKFAVVQISLTWGSTTTANTATAWQFTIGGLTGTSITNVGGALSFDTSASAFYNGVGYLSDTTHLAAVCNNALVGATSPMTWASGDTFNMTVTIQIA